MSSARDIDKNTSPDHDDRRDGDEPKTGPARAGEPENERPRRSTPVTVQQYLQHLPASVVLDRLPTPVVAVGFDGHLVYANPAFAGFLGHPDPHALLGRSLPEVMAEQADTEASGCVTALKAAAGTVVAWCHLEGYHLHATVSPALLARAEDPLLLITLTDVSDLLWNTTR